MRLRQWCLDWFCPTACRWVYFHRGQMVNILVTKGDCLIRAPVDHKWICIYICYIYINIHIMNLLSWLFIDLLAASLPLRPTKHISTTFADPNAKASIAPITCIQRLGSWNPGNRMAVYSIRNFHLKNSCFEFVKVTFWHWFLAYLEFRMVTLRMETQFLVHPTPSMWYLDP